MELTLKVLCSSYIEFNGEIYEKISGDTVNFELDIDESLKDFKVPDGFVSIQEYIRHVLREEMKKEKPFESLTEKIAEEKKEESGVE